MPYLQLLAYINVKHYKFIYDKIVTTDGVVDHNDNQMINAGIDILELIYG